MKYSAGKCSVTAGGIVECRISLHPVKDLFSLISKFFLECGGNNCGCRRRSFNVIEIDHQIKLVRGGLFSTERFFEKIALLPVLLFHYGGSCFCIGIQDLGQAGDAVLIRSDKSDGHNPVSRQKKVSASSDKYR